MSRRILIVDDSKAMRMLVRRSLRQAGYEDYDVDEASSGREALLLIEAATPRVVLSDWNMPEMSGYELLLELRERKIEVPVGLITTEGTPEMRTRASAAGARFLLQKPFTSAELAVALGPILR